MGVPAGTELRGLTVRRGAVALVLLAGLVYAHSLGGAFVWDDEYLYFDNPRVLKETLRSAFTSDLFGFLPQKAAQQYYRPLAILAHSWLARLTNRQPFGLHLASVLVHAGAALLVFLLVLEFAEIRVAWFTAALFLVHPLHVEAVAWMAAFSELLAGALMLASLYVLLRARRGPHWLLAVSYLAAALAFLTKETALALPLLAAIFVGRRAWPFFVMAAGYLGLRFLTLGFAAAPLPSRSLPRHIEIILAAALQYAKNLVWPWPLAPEYHLMHSGVAWAVFAVVCALAAWLAYQKQQIRLALLLLVIPLAPALAASVLLPALRLAQDRYTYVAIVGFALLIAYATQNRAGAAAALLLVALWSTLSVFAILHWRDPETLWKHTLRVTPNSKTAVLSLGHLYYSTGRYEEADRIYQQGLLHRPNDPDYLASRAAVRKVLELSR